MIDKHLAERAVMFVRALKHTKGEWAGTPFQLRPWQEIILRDIFGTVTREGLRQYRTGYVEIPRKNGKSELAAAIALYMLFGDGEPGAEIYSAASERNQASLVFNAAAAMVRSSPTLSKYSRIIDSQKRIVYYKNNSYYQAISADAATKHGFNAHAVIYDELHTAPNRELWDTLATSMGARRQPLMLAITTAGWDRTSICWEQHQIASRILSGDYHDPTYYPVIYGADEKDDWTDERVWKKANPNLGVSIKPEFLRSEYKRAMEIPAYENTFRRLYLDQWTSQETRWIPMEAWDECHMDDPGDLDGEPCYIGLDLSSTTDLTSLTVWYPDRGVAINHNWMPEELVDWKSRLDQIPYWDWIREGIVELTPGNVVDYGFIRERILDIAARNSGLRAIGYDPWNATQLMIQIEQDDGLPVAPIRQGFRTLSPASKELERLVTSRALNHLGNPALRRAAENVRVKADENGNLRPVKNSATGRIDPLMSLIIAIAAQQQTEGVQTGPSVYEERGLLAL